ncbi:MAG: hypothetical protein H6654_14190 [Ardenticatenaceae bacterium]|nr:hypothetical protein [Anaerolineales bacterium]MCB8938951.1 hypothetical protein [Ardenticatenaceae bacterium]MCB8974707.1 hypothetical protein [Ardenticatenaceae bacterium]
MTQSANKTQGLTCPECSGVVPIAEGDRIVECPYCHTCSLVQGERGVRRWQVPQTVERERALQAVTNFFRGMKKAHDLHTEAQIKDTFLVYLPYWRVESFVAGWMFGRVKSGKDSTRPVEVKISELMHWNDAAVDVAEYGVHQVAISKEQLRPYDSDRLHAEAMVFEPSESHTDALEEAERHFTHRGRQKHSLRTKFFEKFHFLRQRLSIVYYPLWVSRYEYHKRNYQVVVDGVNGNLLYGKAPGNILYRAAALVGGLAFGNLILVNGTWLAAIIVGNSDEDGSIALLVAPIAIGIGLIAAGYRAFRYGEEVEEIQRGARKAALAGDGDGRNVMSALTGGLMGNNNDVQDMLRSGLSVLEELTEGKR